MNKVKIILSTMMVICIMFASACSPTSTTPSASETSSTTPSDTTVANTVENKETIYIGVVNFETGNVQGYGADFRKGVELFLDDVNSSGGILGHPVEVVYYDLVDSVQTATNAVKLALENDELSALVTSALSGQTVAFAPFVEEAKIPMVVGGSGANIRDAKYDYLWQVRPLVPYGSVAQVNYAIDVLGSKNPAIWALSLESNSQGMGFAIEQFAAKGIAIPESMQFRTTETETNYTPVVASIKASGADCLITNGNADMSFVYLAKAMRDANLNIPVVNNAALVSAAVIENAGNAIDEWYVVADFTPDNPRPVVQEFVERYDAKFDGKVPDSAAVCGYDLLSLLKAAMEEAGTCTDRQLINDAFSKVKNLDLLMGVANVYEDHTCLDSLTMAKMKNGVPEFIETVVYR